jgi:dTDP-4-amino-4,6-dideoxygalactose transaminase
MIELFQPSPNFKSFRLLKNIFKNKQFLRGDITKLFLKSFSKFQNLPKKKVILGASCSDLIFNIVYTCRNIIKDRFVIVPTNSFPAIPAAVLRSGLKLKLIDIDSQTGNISLNSLNKINKSKIGCVFVTHYGGIPVNIKLLRKMLNKDTLIFEDCAGALGSFHLDGKCVGSKGDFSCWSFDSMKMITCGEGGAAYIKNNKVFKKFSENIFLGLNSNQRSGKFLSSKKKTWWEYQPNSFGSRSIFTEIDAAIGLPQILNINKVLNKRKKLRSVYKKYLIENKNLRIIRNRNGKKYSNYFFTIYATKRNKLARYLYENGIYSSMRYFPISKMKIYSKYKNKSKFDSSDYFSNYALNLPLHQNLSIRSVAKISKMINQFYKTL